MRIGVKEFQRSDDITDWINQEIEYYKIHIISIETINTPEKMAIRVWYSVED